MNTSDMAFYKAFTAHMDQYPLTLEQYQVFLDGDEGVVLSETITALLDARNLWREAIESTNRR